MLQIKLLETSATVWIDGITYHLNDIHVGNVYGQTADLFDSGHQGEAVVMLAGHPVVLEEDDWGKLYTGAEEYLQREFEAFDAEQIKKRKTLH